MPSRLPPDRAARREAVILAYELAFRRTHRRRGRRWARRLVGRRWH